MFDVFLIAKIIMLSMYSHILISLNSKRHKYPFLYRKLIVPELEKLDYDSHKYDLDNENFCHMPMFFSPHSRKEEKCLKIEDFRSK